MKRSIKFLHRAKNLRYDLGLAFAAARRHVRETAQHLRSYGRRKARPLSERKEQLLKALLPDLRLPLEGPAPVPLSKLFREDVSEVWLEIGFGSGEHIFWQAEHNPGIGLIGCEPFINGVASLLGKIERAAPPSIRVHDGDAREVLAWLPNQSIARIFVLFPDPWPKKRHAKRRLLTTDTIAQMARVLRQGGELRFATDSGALCRRSLARLAFIRLLRLHGRACGRLADEAGGLARNALRAEGLEGGAQTGLSQVSPPPSVTRNGARKGGCSMRGAFLMLLLFSTPALALDAAQIKSACYTDCEAETEGNPSYKACVARAADTADALLNTEFKRLQDDVRKQAEFMQARPDAQLRMLTDAQRKWIAYRDCHLRLRGQSRFRRDRHRRHPVVLRLRLKLRTDKRF